MEFNLVDTSIATPAPDDTLKVPCKVYSRIVGYYTDVSSWNDGKAQEFKERTVFDVDAILARE